MAVTQVYTAVPNDVITAARWNNEFGNIYNNGTSVAFPLTQGVSFAGFTITLDASGVVTLSSSAAQGLIYTPGARSGATGTGANEGSNLKIAASTFTDSATAGSGTNTEFSSVSIQTPTLAATNTSVTTTDAATLYIQAAPTAGTNQTLTNSYAIWVDSGAVRFDGTLHVDSTSTLTGLVTTTAGVIGQNTNLNHIAGLIISNDGTDPTNDIGITVGEATSTHATPGTRVPLRLSSALIKRLDASWVTGTNQGGLSSSLSISDTNYHVFIIRVAGVDDIGFDTSIVAANLITDHSATAFRRIGWIKRAAGAIVAFTAYELPGGGLEYLWSSPTLDVDLSATLTTTRRTDVIRVPLDYSVEAHLNVEVDDSTQTSVAWIYCPDQADQAPSETAAPLGNLAIEVAAANPTYQIYVRTSATGTVAARANVATMDEYRIVTIGFKWSRR